MDPNTQAALIDLAKSSVPSLIAVMGTLGGGYLGYRYAGEQARKQLERSHELEVERMVRGAEASSLQEQLRYLYGPLDFFVTQNEELLRMAGQIDTSSAEAFKGPWSPEPSDRSALTEQIEATIELKNEYARRVVRNNSCVMQILEQNWHLVDPADVSIFAPFQVDQVRFQTEVKEERRKKVPSPVLESLGTLFYLRPEMTERVKSAMAAKQRRLRELREPLQPKTGGSA